MKQIKLVTRFRAWHEGEMEQDGQKVQTSSYKVNLNTEDVIYMMTIANTAKWFVRKLWRGSILRVLLTNIFSFFLFKLYLYEI